MSVPSYTKKRFSEFSVEEDNWPAHSPDLSCIQHLLDEFERWLWALPRCPTSLMLLWLKRSKPLQPGSKMNNGDCCSNRLMLHYRHIWLSSYFWTWSFLPFLSLVLFLSNSFSAAPHAASSFAVNLRPFGLIGAVCLCNTGRLCFGYR